MRNTLMVGLGVVNIIRGMDKRAAASIFADAALCMKLSTQSRLVQVMVLSWTQLIGAMRKLTVASVFAWFLVNPLSA